MLRLMIEDEGFCILATQQLEGHYFENPALTWLYGRIRDHQVSYSRPPSFLALYEYLRDLDPTIAQQYQPVIVQLEQTPVTDPQFITDRIVDFVKRNLFVAGMEEARALYNKGATDDAFDFWMRRGEEINQVSLGAVDRGWFFLELPERQRRRQYQAAASHLHTFSTGIPDLDKILNGGLSLGELGIWIAKHKTGKSMLLAWLVFYAVRALRVPVLVTVHEGGREYWEDRLEASFAHTVTALVTRGELDPATHQRLVDEYRELSQLLVIRGYTKDEGTWNATVGDIYAEVKDLRTRYGFRPKMIVCDYGDLLKSQFKADSETAHQTAAFKDLKSLSDKDQGYAVWTASQAQRLPARADRDPTYLIRAEQVADAIGKVRVADFYGSLNRTHDEERENRIRLFAEQYRKNQAGRVIELETDYGRSRFVKSVLSSEAAPVDAEQREFEL
jgi:KaiC/GvpD/RAD55 family RecA-like ATPase